MRDRLIHIPRALLLALACAWTGPGCSAPPPESKIAIDTTPTRVALKDFLLYFSNRVEIAADDIAQKVTDPAIRRTTVYWKMRVIPLAQDALLNPHDDAALIQMWILTATMEQAFKGPLGEYFGSGQSIAQATAKDVNEQAKDLAQSLLKPEIFAQYEPQIEKLVKRPIASMDLSVNSKSKEPVTWGQSLSEVLSKPLDLIKVPASSLNPTSGLSDTAIAMQNFTDEFSRARTQLFYIPRQLRWQAQLLLLETEETVNLSGMASGVAQVGASAENMAATAKDLPAQLRTELTAFAEELGKPQGELQATLKEANTTLTNSRETAQALDTMGTTFTQMFGAFDKLMGTLGVGPDSAGAGAADTAPAADPTDQGPPFDINDYGRTAEKLTETANALTALLEKTTDLADAPEPPPLLVDTEATARALMNRFFLGCGGLIVFWAVVAYLYRAATARHRTR